MYQNDMKLTAICLIMYFGYDNKNTYKDKES